MNYLFIVVTIHRLARPDCYATFRPPSIVRISPLIMEAASEAKKATASATSYGSTNLP